MTHETKTASLQFIEEGHCVFRVWAPEKEKMVLHLVHPGERYIDMQREEAGYFTIEAGNVHPGTLYYYRPNNENDLADPASFFQPQGVQGPSQVVDHGTYVWKDAQWKGLPLEQCILYELHVGTFTPEGTFEAIIPRLDALKATGINALELMPVAQFPGNRNWGYDGVYPYAVQNSYGGPEGLKKLVDACHGKGLAVILDVVYNHVGPQGNYFDQFGPYFTDQYKTPWGRAINFDGPWSDGVRDYFSDNALYWFQHYHIDGLRVDAIHSMYDNGAVHFWELTYNKIRKLEEELGRSFFMIAESDYNSPRVVKPPSEGGFGFTAQWLDDFHHALYTLLDPKGRERYIDFGRLQQLAKAYKDGFVHSGEWVKFRKRRFGASSAGVPGNKFIVFNLNHDQVGNRVGGERLCMLVNEERVKMAAAALLLAPYVPMLFMGEEYADDTPFYYFVSHSDPQLIQAVREGRRSEFKDFGFEVEPPDPQDEKTFDHSKIHWEQRNSGQHKIILEWHQTLIRFRQTLPALKNFDKAATQVKAVGEKGLALLRKSQKAKDCLLALFNFSEQAFSYTVPDRLQGAQKLLDSKESRWREAGQKEEAVFPLRLDAGEVVTVQPLSVVVYYSQSNEVAFEEPGAGSQ